MTTSDWVRGALSWLATYGLHSSLFLGSAWLLCTLRAPRAVKNRERVWKLALLGGLLSATLQIALDARPLLGRIDWREPVAAVAELDPRAEPAAVSEAPSQSPEHGPARAPEADQASTEPIEKMPAASTEPAASHDVEAQEPTSPRYPARHRAPRPAPAHGEAPPTAALASSTGAPGAADAAPSSGSLE